MKTTWERGRPARTRLAQLHLSPPLRSTRKGTVPGPLCKGCSRFVPHYHSPLEGESHEMKTTWERGRPARTRLAQLHLSPPLRSTRKGAVPGPPCKGCSRFVPHYHSPLEGESQKPSRQAKADAVGGGNRAARLRRAATPDRFSALLIYRKPLCDTARYLCVWNRTLLIQDSITRNDPSHPLNPRP